MGDHSVVVLEGRHYVILSIIKVGFFITVARPDHLRIGLIL